MNKIQSTTNYDRFQRMEGNRETGRRVNSLIREVKRRNLLPQFPIVCQRNGHGKLVIADGQHRFEAAKALKLPIFFVEGKNITVEDVARVNSAAKAWNLRDYLASWIGQGRRDYIVLRDFMQTYGIPISTAIEILSGGRGGNSLRNFREGRFQAKNVSHGHRVGAALVSLRTIVPFYSERSFVIAISRLLMVREFDLDRFISKLGYQASKLIKRPAWEDYLPTIEEIYNFKSRKSELQPLVVSVKKLSKGNEQ